MVFVGSNKYNNNNSGLMVMEENVSQCNSLINVPLMVFREQ